MYVVQNLICKAAYFFGVFSSTKELVKGVTRRRHWQLRAWESSVYAV